MLTLTRSCKAWQGLARYGDSVQPGQEDVFLVGPSSTLPERVFPAKVSRDLVGLVSLLLPCKALQDSATFTDDLTPTCSPLLTKAWHSHPCKIWNGLKHRTLSGCTILFFSFTLGMQTYTIPSFLRITR